MVDIRPALKKIRIKKQLTQQQVASVVGISQRNYSDIERAKSNPSWEVAQRLEQFFGIPASELLAKAKK